MLRFLKYYVVIAVVASLLSVAMGFRMNFYGANERIYCDFEVTEGRANIRTENGYCRLRIDRIIGVFWRVFLVLFFMLNVPALLIARFWYQGRRDGSFSHDSGDNQRRSTSVAIRQPPDSGMSGGRFHNVAVRIDRHAGLFFVGYFVVTAVAAVQVASLDAWINIDHNQDMQFCWAGGAPSGFDFYSGGEPCAIQYQHLFVRGVAITIMAATVLNGPTLAYYLLKSFVLAIARGLTLKQHPIEIDWRRAVSRAKARAAKFKAPMIE